MKPKIQIVIPAINLWNSYTKNCIESIKTKYEYRILLIDNNSTDETKEEAGKLVSDRFSHLRNDVSLSCAASWNVGIQDGFDRGYEYCLVLNNDILLHPEAIDRLVERFWPKGYDMELQRPNGEANLVMVTMHDIKSECEKSEDIFNKNPEDKKDCPESEHPHYSAFMINKVYWDKIGPFDEEFYPAYFEDNSSHYKIKLARLKAICLPTATFYHFGSRTQNEALGWNNPVVTGPAFERNRDVYVKMWGGLPEHETYKTKFNE